MATSNGNGMDLFHDEVDTANDGDADMDHGVHALDDQVKGYDTDMGHDAAVKDICFQTGSRRLLRHASTS